MRELIDQLQDIKLVIFDLDGVIYRGETLIPGANTIIQELKGHSIKVMYNSNNSTATRKAYVENLEKFRIPSEISDFYTSASITAAEITKIKKNANIFVIGEVGLREELRTLGHIIIIEPINYEDIDFVIVGFDRNITYNTLAIAQRCILEGNARFYATNADSTYPVADGLKPGAGTMVSALATCVGKKPLKIFGKPEPFGIQMMLKDTQIPAKNACIIGDRLNTDILAGNRAEIKTIAVLTGVTTREMIEDVKNQSQISNEFDEKLIPNIIIANLNEIFKK